MARHPEELCSFKQQAPSVSVCFQYFIKIKTQTGKSSKEYCDYVFVFEVFGNFYFKFIFQILIGLWGWMGYSCSHSLWFLTDFALLSGCCPFDVFYSKAKLYEAGTGLDVEFTLNQGSQNQQPQAPELLSSPVGLPI